jgi:plasmid stabilization system protein ParE
MILPVVFRRIAKQEMDESIAWYENERAGLGFEFAVEIEESLSAIVNNPKQFRQVRGNIRRAVMLRFPFTIHFLIESDRIVVLAVFHVKRNPKQLEGR